jgi:DNA-binding CsgD family transcriptional regulator
VVVRASSRTSAAAFSPIMMAGGLVLPRQIDGMTGASATRSPLTPWTRKRESTTGPMGRDFDWSHLPRMTDSGEAEVLEAHAAAVDLQLVDDAGAHRFRFRHALTVDAILSDMLGPQRARLAGEALDELLGSSEWGSLDLLELAAHLAVEAGRLADAARCLTEDARRALLRVLERLAFHDLSRGRGPARMEEGRASALELGALGLAVAFDHVLATHYLVADELELATACAERALANARRYGLRELTVLLGSLYGVASVVKAAAGARELVQGRDWVAVDDVYQHSSFCIARAIIAGRAGDRERAAALFAEGDDGLVAVPWVRAMYRRYAGEAALVDGWGQPAGWLAEAEVYLGDRGNEPLARACRSLLRLAGTSPRRRRARSEQVRYPGLDLTTREADVLALLADGLTNKEIGVRLYLSPRTVEKHVERILAKTGQANRTALAAFATERAPVAPAS